MASARGLDSILALAGLSIAIPCRLRRAASLSIAIGIAVRWSGLLFGSMMFLFVAMIHLRGVLVRPRSLDLGLSFAKRHSAAPVGSLPERRWTVGARRARARWSTPAVFVSSWPDRLRTGVALLVLAGSTPLAKDTRTVAALLQSSAGVKVGAIQLLRRHVALCGSHPRARERLATGGLTGESSPSARTPQVSTLKSKDRRRPTEEPPSNLAPGRPENANLQYRR